MCLGVFTFLFTEKNCKLKSVLMSTSIAQTLLCFNLVSVKIAFSSFFGIYLKQAQSYLCLQAFNHAQVPHALLSAFKSKMLIYNICPQRACRQGTSLKSFLNTTDTQRFAFSAHFVSGCCFPSVRIRGIRSSRDVTLYNQCALNL